MYFTNQVSNMNLWVLSIGIDDGPPIISKIGSRKKCKKKLFKKVDKGLVVKYGKELRASYGNKVFSITRWSFK